MCVSSTYYIILDDAVVVIKDDLSYDYLYHEISATNKCTTIRTSHNICIFIYIYVYLYNLYSIAIIFINIISNNNIK